MRRPEVEQFFISSMAWHFLVFLQLFCYCHFVHTQWQVIDLEEYKQRTNGSIFLIKGSGQRIFSTDHEEGEGKQKHEWRYLFPRELMKILGISRAKMLPDDVVINIPLVGTVVSHKISNEPQQIQIHEQFNNMIKTLEEQQSIFSHAATLEGFTNVVETSICTNLHVCMNLDSESSEGNKDSSHVVIWKLPAYYDSSSACDALANTNKKEIIFAGDSFMRHVFEAFILILTGNYNHGAISTEECEGEGQFSLKDCRRSMPDSINVCSNRIKLSTISTISQQCSYFGQCNFKNKTLCREDMILLYSEGAHPANCKYNEQRNGAYDPTLYAEKFARSEICNSRIDGLETFYLSTHARPTDPRAIKGISPSEYSFNIENYNERMRVNIEELVSTGKCRNVPWIDVYNMTATLIRYFYRNSTYKDNDNIDVVESMLRNKLVALNRLTYDANHYGSTVNLIKAQIIMNAIVLENNKKKKMQK